MVPSKCLRAGVEIWFYVACLVMLDNVASAGVRVEVTHVDGRVIVGSWLPNDLDAEVDIETDTGRASFATRDLMSLRFLSPEDCAVARSWPIRIWTRDGGSFDSDIIEFSPDQLSLQIPHAESVRIPAADVAALRWNRHALPDEPIQEYLSRNQIDKDLLLVMDDSQIRSFEGMVQTLSTIGGTFMHHGRPLNFTSEKAYGLVFAGSAKSETPTVICDTTCGNRWTGAWGASDGSHVVLRAWGSHPIAIPISQVSEVHFRSTRVVMMSGLTPAHSIHNDCFGISWPVQIDRSVSGKPLRMAGHTYEHGIGVHADTTLTYRIDGEYEGLAATIGVDDAVRPLGSVVFRIKGDDRLLYESPILTGKDAPRNISVSLSGVKQLELVVDSAGDLDIADQADWGNLRLIRPTRDGAP